MLPTRQQRGQLNKNKKKKKEKKEGQCGKETTFGHVDVYTYNIHTPSNIFILLSTKSQQFHLLEFFSFEKKGQKD